MEPRGNVNYVEGSREAIEKGIVKVLGKKLGLETLGRLEQFAGEIAEVGDWIDEELAEIEQMADNTGGLMYSPDGVDIVLLWIKGWIEEEMR